ncbi:uncharacterized protein J3R85_006002 [Psidium guajava]|nr:uncharacterized protein J3R85_006002 [Psidium guajava]
MVASPNDEMETSKPLNHTTGKNSPYHSTATIPPLKPDLRASLDPHSAVAVADDDYAIIGQKSKREAEAMVPITRHFTFYGKPACAPTHYFTF